MYCLLLHAKVVPLAFKPLLHNPFLRKERKINSFIAVIVLLVIASLVVPYSHHYHSTSPHLERNTHCGADLLLPCIRFSSVLPFLQSLPCVRVFLQNLIQQEGGILVSCHASLYLISIGDIRA